MLSRSRLALSTISGIRLFMSSSNFLSCSAFCFACASSCCFLSAFSEVEKPPFPGGAAYCTAGYNPTLICIASEGMSGLGANDLVACQKNESSQSTMASAALLTAPCSAKLRLRSASGLSPYIRGSQGITSTPSLSPSTPLSVVTLVHPAVRSERSMLEAARRASASGTTSIIAWRAEYGRRASTVVQSAALVTGLKYPRCGMTLGARQMAILSNACSSFCSATSAFASSCFASDIWSVRWAACLPTATAAVLASPAVVLAISAISDAPCARAWAVLASSLALCADLAASPASFWRPNTLCSLMSRMLVSNLPSLESITNSPETPATTKTTLNISHISFQRLGLDGNGIAPRARALSQSRRSSTWSQIMKTTSHATPTTTRPVQKCSWPCRLSLWELRPVSSAFSAVSSIEQLRDDQVWWAEFQLYAVIIVGVAALIFVCVMSLFDRL
jgi:hypothetical protein